jgi:hypothetical protein
MMDPRPLYPQGYHPIEVNRSKDLRQRAKHMTRTERPCKYFFTGFSASQTFHINSGHVKMPYHAGKDATVPEHQYQAVGCLVDPFAVDVYCLGNFLRTDFLQVCPDSYIRRGFDSVSVTDPEGFRFSPSIGGQHDYRQSCDSTHDGSGDRPMANYFEAHPQEASTKALRLAC